MKTQAFSAVERHFLTGHTLCFLAALIFFLQGIFLPCLICILLLGLSLPLFLLSDKPAALFVRHMTESPEAEGPAESVEPPFQSTESKPPVLSALPDPSAPSLPPGGHSLPDDDSLSVLPGPVKEPAPLDLLSLCEETGKELCSLYRLYPSQFRILSEEKDLILSTDQSLLTLVLHNLMDNGAKYARYGCSRGARFTLTLSRQDSDALLIFRNNTCGVPGSEIPHLTGRNRQGSNRISGTGLGLFQADAAVRALQGSLKIKSSPGTGFAVYLRLPDLGEPSRYSNSIPPKEEPYETA